MTESKTARKKRLKYEARLKWQIAELEAKKKKNIEFIAKLEALRDGG